MNVTSSCVSSTVGTDGVRVERSCGNVSLLWGLPGSFPNHCWLRGEKDPAQKRGRKMSLRCSASSGAPQLRTPYTERGGLKEGLNWAETPRAADAGRELPAGKGSRAGR